MAYELVLGYVDGSSATQASVAVSANTLAMLGLVTNYAGNALAWVVAIFAGWLSLLGPASSVIEGVTFIGFVGFFVFMAAMGVALLRRRPSVEELSPASVH